MRRVAGPPPSGLSKAVTDFRGRRRAQKAEEEQAVRRVSVPPVDSRELSTENEKDNGCAVSARRWQGEREASHHAVETMLSHTCDPG
jgi:hypothetical protein